MPTFAAYSEDGKHSAISADTLQERPRTEKKTLKNLIQNESALSEI